MKNINQLMITGNIVRDMSEGDFRYTQGGMAIAKISIACNDVKKDQAGNWVDDPSFFDVSIFGKAAENLRPYLTKGQGIIICGRLKQNRWTDQNGQNHSKIDILADMVELKNKPNQSNGQNQNAQNQYQNNGQNQNFAPQMQQNQNYAPQQPQQYQNGQNQNFTQQQPQFNGDLMNFPEQIPF